MSPRQSFSFSCSRSDVLSRHLPHSISAQSRQNESVFFADHFGTKQITLMGLYARHNGRVTRPPLRASNTVLPFHGGRTAWSSVHNWVGWVRVTLFFFLCRRKELFFQHRNREKPPASEAGNQQVFMVKNKSEVNPPEAKPITQRKV